MNTVSDRHCKGEHGREKARVARVGRSWPTRLAFVASLLLALPLAATARAQIQVDCDAPDDFCTGDPCVTPDQIEVTVASCVLDFSPRALVIAESVTVPNNGTLSLTAGSIEVQRRIDGRHTDSGAGDGADISLIASGNVIIRKPVNVSAKATNGSILIDAGGNVELRQVLRARGMGKAATATGGTVTVNADGTVTSTIRGKIDARGRSKHTMGGQVSIGAANGVDLKSRIDVRGSTGGSISIASSNGDVTLAQKIRAKGAPDSGGIVAVQAQGDINADFKARIEADGTQAHVGLITFTAAGTIDVHALSASSNTVGGTISVYAGTVSTSLLRARGRDVGGTITGESTVGDLSVRRVQANATGATGGSITLASAANLTVFGTGIVDGDDTGGEMRFSCNGDMVLDGGSFNAEGDITGGVIEGIAGGDLTADGNFRAQVGGCIGLSAGGTLNDGGATFDVALSGSCP